MLLGFDGAFSILLDVAVPQKLFDEVEVGGTIDSFPQKTMLRLRYSCGDMDVTDQLSNGPQSRSCKPPACTRPCNDTILDGPVSLYRSVAHYFVRLDCV